MEPDGRAWRIYLVAGLTFAAAHLLLPSNRPASSFAFLAIAVSGLVAMVVGVRRRARAEAWTLVLVGASLMVAGDVLWIWYDVVADVDPFPSLADALYLPGYPLIAMGLLRMLRGRDRGSERPGLIDATIIATGCGVLAWVFLIAPYARDTDLMLVERAVSSAYPLMGILLVAVVSRLGFTHGGLHASDILVGLSLIALLIADIYLGVIELTVGYEWHAVPEFLWLAMYVLLGAAALAPEPETVGSDDDPAVENVRLRGIRLPLLLLASLMAPGVLAWHAVQGRNIDLFVIAVGSALLFLLVVARILGLVHQVEAKAAEVALLAAADPLTGLPNRRRWDDEIERLLALATRAGGPVCVAMMDLDHFKRFNDAHGHYAGDLLLRDCAEAWYTQLRATDILARVGGDEFALALPNCPLDRAEAVLKRLRTATPRDETFSSGVALWNGEESARDLQVRADMALYAAKAEGRDRMVRAHEAATQSGDAIAR